MNDPIIDKRAHEIAHTFVSCFWNDIAANPATDDKSDLVFQVELWITTAGGLLTFDRGIKRVADVARKCRRIYENDFALGHGDEVRMAIIQGLGYTLFDYVQAPQQEIDMYELWYDVLAAGLVHESTTDIRP